MGGIAVMTNCALLSLSPQVRSYFPAMSPAEWLLLFVIIEHGLLSLKIALRQLIPDVPAWVKISLACLEYRSRQALKNEVNTNTNTKIANNLPCIKNSSVSSLMLVAAFFFS
jgi:anoctamin-10